MEVSRLDTCVAALDAALAKFVAIHAGVRQRDPAWYAMMGKTIGGSEIATLVGKSPYAAYRELVASKAAQIRGEDTWRGGGEACWWGVFFEDIISAYVAVDLGSEIRGDEICVQVYENHRNSPDGYIVARLGTERLGTERLELWTTDMDPARAVVARIVLLEFKCPLSRAPTGAVPEHYRPQVLSGLAVSPIAGSGLFVDAVFRRCALSDLGPSAAYDNKSYHTRDARGWAGAVAWGIAGIYAEEGSAVGDRLRRDAEGFGPFPGTGPPSAWPPADFGSVAPRVFGSMLGALDRRQLRADKLPACFADGRGDQRLRNGAAAVVAELQRSPPPNAWLVGVVPWKLFSVDYLPVDRDPKFFAEVRPRIEAAIKLATAAAASPDIAAHLSAAGLGSRRTATPRPGIDDLADMRPAQGFTADDAAMFD